MENALVVHPVISGKGHERSPVDAMAEAEGLVHAIHLGVSSSHTVKLATINPATFLGKGTVERLAAVIADETPVVVIVNTSLSPGQQRNLEKAWNTKVIDRTGLILEIFGERAATREGKIQVDLAMLTYQKSRLVRSWTHLERQRGGGGFMGGPGETQIELDRRSITTRIAQLKKDLEQVRKTRALSQANRAKVPFPVVALVGYTNAGKSTLFNRLTGAGVFAENLLFATLDPTLRRVKPPGGGLEFIVSDTVGFIADLPTTLIEAFRATLEQVQEADLILHVRDMSRRDRDAQRDDVVAVLSELDIDTATDTRIVEVWNKIDIMAEDDRADLMREAGQSHSRGVLVSAISGEGVEALLLLITKKLSESHRLLMYKIPPEDGAARAWLFTHGDVLPEDDHHAGDGFLSVRLSAAIQGRFESQFRYHTVEGKK